MPSDVEARYGTKRGIAWVGDKVHPTATAANLVRVAAWLEGTPRATTRRSALAALAA